MSTVARQTILYPGQYGPLKIGEGVHVYPWHPSFTDYGPVPNWAHLVYRIVRRMFGFVNFPEVYLTLSLSV